MAWKVTGGVYWKMPLRWNVSDAFLMSRLGLSIWGRKTRGKMPFHHVISSAHTINRTNHRCCGFDHLPEVVLVRLLHSKLSPPLAWLHSLWEKVHVCSAHLSGVTLHLFEGKIHKLFGLTPHGKIFSSPLFIYLLNYLYQYGFMSVFFFFMLWFVIQY